MKSNENPRNLWPADPISTLPVVERVKVNEIFYSLQGESTRVGRPCVLVRLTGCQMRCTWCDTVYSFYQGDWRTFEDILATVASYDCPIVELTGGEPLLQPGSLPLMELLCDAGYEVLLETGGGVDIEPVDQRVRRIVDVKCPASGEVDNNRWANLEQLRATDEVKFVLADRADYDWAKEVCERYRLPERCPVHFSPVVSLPGVAHGGSTSSSPPGLDPADLAAWILEDRLRVRLQLQVHKQLWGDKKGV